MALLQDINTLTEIDVTYVLPCEVEAEGPVGETCRVTAYLE